MTSCYVKDYLKRNRVLVLCLVLIFLVITATGITIASLIVSEGSATPLEQAEQLLSNVILFDGHNDLAINIRDLFYNDLSKFNLSKNLSGIEPWFSHNFSQTDIPRLRAGKVKAQFWVVRAECESQFKDAVEITLEQIDLIRRLIANYSSDLELVTSSAELLEAVENDKIASLIGLNGGHSIQWSLGILRLYYDLGVRYMTLTQSCSTPWADCSLVDSPNPYTRWRPLSLGLSEFGEAVIFEMNRIGMIIDLSQSSIATMKEVLLISKAPVIFSHSSARALCNTDKNVPDEILKLVRQKDAVVMVNFYPGVLRCGDTTNTSVADVVDHIEYLRNKTTIDNVGLGSDYDGVDSTPEGLEDVSKYPNLFAALIETGRWSDSDLEKLAGKNILRVLQEVENVRDAFASEDPQQIWMKKADLKKTSYNFSCTSAPLEDSHISVDLGRYGVRL